MTWSKKARDFAEQIKNFELLPETQKMGSDMNSLISHLRSSALALRKQADRWDELQAKGCTECEGSGSTPGIGNYIPCIACEVTGKDSPCTCTYCDGTGEQK